MKRYVAATVLILGALVLSGSSAQATPFYFDAITANSAVDPGIGESQLWVDVIAGGAGQASFVFHNDGPLACSITDVYFDDGTLLGIAAISGSAGVSFAEGAAPPDLPSGTNIGFDAVFSADSNPPAQPNGVNPGEWLMVTFNLLGGGTLADVTSELVSADLRVGIHVQGFADGQSESFVNVPEPSLLLLLGSGLLGIGLVRRKKDIA